MRCGLRKVKHEGRGLIGGKDLLLSTHLHYVLHVVPLENSVVQLIGSTGRHILAVEGS